MSGGSKPVWHASGGRKANALFNKFMPMAMSTPHSASSATWRPAWLKNLEQDIAIDGKLDVYIMARGGEIQLGRSPRKKSPKSKKKKGDEEEAGNESPKPKWTPQWLWNNHGVKKHSFDREMRSEEEVKAAYEAWKMELEAREKTDKEAKEAATAKKREEKRLRFTKNISKSISYEEFCEEARRNKIKEKNRLKKTQEDMVKEWEGRLEEKRKQVKLMKIKNARYREEQKRRVKHGPPGSRKPLKLKKKPKYFAKDKSANAKSGPIVSVLNPPKKDSHLHHHKQRPKTTSAKRSRRNRMSQDDIAALYRLSVSPLVNPPTRHGNWQAIRPTSAPKGMPRFLTRLEQTTDAPLDMRKPIKKALKKASSALDIRMTPPRYPAPRLRRKNRGSPKSTKAVYNPNPNTRPKTTPNSNIDNNDTEPTRPNTSDPTMYQSLEHEHSTQGVSIDGGKENSANDDVEKIETDEERLAREERYRLRRIAAEKEEQERLAQEEAARAKAAERMRLIKERDAIEKAKEEEEQRKIEEEEIARRLKANEEKMARRKKAFEEAQDKKRLEQKKIEDEQKLKAAQNIQRIGRGKIARKRVSKIKEDRKKKEEAGKEVKEDALATKSDVINGSNAEEKIVDDHQKLGYGLQVEYEKDTNAATEEQVVENHQKLGYGLPVEYKKENESKIEEEEEEEEENDKK